MTSNLVAKLRAEVVVPYKDGYEPMRAPPSKLMTDAADEIERVTGDFQQVHRNCIHAREVADRALDLLARVPEAVMPPDWHRALGEVRTLAQAVPTQVETSAQCTCDPDCWNPNCVVHVPATETTDERVIAEEIRIGSTICRPGCRLQTVLDRIERGLQVKAGARFEAEDDREPIAEGDARYYSPRTNQGDSGCVMPGDSQVKTSGEPT